MGRPAKIEIERPVEIKDGKPKRGRKKKSPYDLNTRDIARTIYKLDINTSLTRAQIEEAVYIYFRTIARMLSEPTVPEQLTIAFPEIGKLSFLKNKGRKKGQIYKRPSFEKKGEIITTILEEDEGDYLSPKFKFMDSLRTKIKDNSQERDLKEKQNGRG